MAAVNFDEKIAEAVRNYQVLENKECKGFKDNRSKTKRGKDGGVNGCKQR